MTTKSKIAVIYFSRSAKNEADHKDWSNHSSRAQRVAISNFLHTQTQSVLKNSDLDIIYYNEDNQIGKTFGERISNAFKSTFELGYDAAISIGNDCLDLKTIDFTHVENTLRKGSAILGPTFRNGAYLIGQSKDDFDFERFEKLSWQTNKLQDDLEAYFQTQSCSVTLLGTLRDINEIQDFRKILEKLSKNSSIARKISRLITSRIVINIFKLNFEHSPVFRNTHLRRGPPIAC